MDPRDLRILIRDDNDEYVGELDVYNKFSGKAEFNKAGSFTLTTDLSNPKKDLLLATGAGISILRNGSSIFSGPIWYLQKSWNQTQKFEELKVTGITDTGLMATRIVIPEPATLSPPYSTDSHHVETGTGSTVLYNYINEHLGPGARTGRPFSGITMASDPLIGTTITGRGRYDNLLEFIQELAIRAGGLGVEIINKVVTLYSPTDKSSTIVLSRDLGNLLSYKYNFRYPVANYVFVAGQNQGTARTIVERADSTSRTNFGTYEFFKDQRDESVTANLESVGDALLEENATKYSITVEPTEESGIEFQQHYKLGDKIRARIDGENFDHVVREVNIELTPEKATVKPVLGTVDSTQNEMINQLIFRDRRIFDRRLRTIERV